MQKERLLVYSYDAETKAYKGNEYANESPLEPGVFHLPASTTDIAPGETKAGKIQVFDEKKNVWKYEDAPEVEAVKVPTPDQKESWKKMDRNALLFKSDWTQLQDNQARMSDSERRAWVKYRQELRDLTKSKKWPNVEFPKAPNE